MSSVTQTVASLDLRHQAQVEVEVQVEVQVEVEGLTLSDRRQGRHKNS